MTWTHPLKKYFVIPRLTLHSGNQCKKFEVFSFSCSRDILGDQNLKLVTWHDQTPFKDSLSSLGWDLILSTCLSNRGLFERLFDFNRNYATTLYRFRVTTSYLWKVTDFNLSHLHLMIQLGWPHSNFVEIIGIRKLESLCYHVTLFMWF